MFIRRLHIEGFRNLTTQTIVLDPYVNVFVGQNGSGKSSLLESVCFLALGRSFRLSCADGLINFSKNFIAVNAVYGNLCSQQITVSAEKHKSQHKINKIGGAGASLAQIAEIAPTQIIHESSSKLVLGEADCRRKFLDWMVFYAHQRYYGLWRGFNKILLQRNCLLKQSKAAQTKVIQELDAVFVALARQIQELRHRVWLRFYEVWKQCFYVLGFQDELRPKVCLFPGWEGELFENLVTARDKDVRQGFSSVGPHRADLMFYLRGRRAKEVLSRGQAKAITLSLLLSRALFLQQETAESFCPSVLLIDDLMAELDSKNGGKIVDFLVNNKRCLQTVITGTNQQDLLTVLPQTKGAWFHVDSGVVQKLRVN